MYLQLKKTSWQHPRQSWKQTQETTLETREEPGWETGREVLCTKRSNESWARLMKSVGQSNCNLVRKQNRGARSSCWKTATKTSEKGRADVEGAGKRYKGSGKHKRTQTNGSTEEKCWKNAEENTPKTDQDAPTTKHSKTPAACNDTRINYNNNHWPGDRKLLCTRPTTETQTLTRGNAIAS